MLVGNAGIVAGIASLIAGFTGEENNQNGWVNIVILASGQALLWTLAQSNWVDKRLSRIINRILKKHTHMDVNDYASLLHLAGEYRISEIGIEANHWLYGMKLKEAKLRDEGLIVLGILRKDASGDKEHKELVEEQKDIVK
jgi:hypothetical protein